MSKIRILPDNLANQIAAGEVVERPASVVKELLENALDAGARRLGIDIELGGRRLMRISDDGEGMGRDDAVLAFERHATSKIRNLEDLSRIKTLGFRGEALASIASVARVELVSKREEDRAGSRVVIEGGKLIDVSDVARGRGTTITVRELFFNTPARRKFMRSEATENYHLTNIVTHYALANPEIAIAMTNNGREVFRVSPARDLRERAYQVFGGNLVESLVKVSGGREFIARVSGYTSAPRERRTTRDSQYFFINGRFVKDRLLSRAISEGYRSVLPHGVYPVSLLFLDVPLEEIDVNVHPAKTEVRFRRAEAIKETIAEAIKEALQSGGFLRDFVPESGADEARLQGSPRGGEPIQQRIEFAAPANGNQISEAQAHAEARDSFQIPDFSSDFEELAMGRESGKVEAQDKPVFAGPIVAEASDDVPLTFAAGYAVLPPVDSALKATKAIEVNKIDPTRIRPIGQLHESYIIAADDEGLLLIDQHVAHERILFDKFRKKEGEREEGSQNLLIPETLDLSPAQSLAFQLVEPELERLGFSLMQLSGRTVAIKAVPAGIEAPDARNLLGEILDTVDREKRGGAIESIRDEIAASLACKAAVKVNMKLTPEKMQWMIDRLVLTANAITCPHGRPIVLRLTMKDIERSFHRK